LKEGSSLILLNGKEVTRMQYNIEPFSYGRTFAESSGLSRKDIKKDDLEEVLRSMPSPSLDGFDLTAKLPISFEAKVLRKLNPKREIVRLSSDGREIDLFRDVSCEPGDIGVSCNPYGDEVSVDTLNIKFRDYNDSFTDRGIVWVFPGNPASIRLFVKAQALKIPGAVAEIITAAEETLRTKILVHFQ
jgi:hypothetical protein